MQPVAGTADQTSGADGSRAGFTAAAVVLVGLVVAFEWPYVTGEWVPGGIDGPRMSLPQRYFLHHAVADGEFPLWNPFEALGLPWLAQLAPGLLHPLNALAAFVEPLRAFAWNHVLAVLCAALGAFAVAAGRGLGPFGALTAGVAFGLSGTIVTQANLHYLVANATVPWVLWGADRLRREPGPLSLLATSAALALVCFAGDVQGTIVGAALALLGLATGERRGEALRWLVLAGVVAVGLALVQLWPSVEALVGSGRLAFDLSARDRWSLTSAAWPELLFTLPGAGSMPEGVRATMGLSPMPWIERPGLGVVLLGLVAAGAAVSVRARLDALAGLVLLWAAFGPGGGASELLSRLPVWRSFQYPEKMLPFATLCFSLAAAAGATSLAKEAAARRSGLVVLSALGLAAAGTWLACASEVSWIPQGWAAVTRSAWAVNALVAAVVVGAVATLGGRPRVLGAVLVAGLLVPSLLLPSRLGLTQEAQVAGLAPWAAREIMRLHDNRYAPRTLSLDEDLSELALSKSQPRNALAFGYALQFGIESIRPYHPFSNRGHATLCLDPGNRGDWCLRLLGVEYVMRPTVGGVPGGFDFVGRNPSGAIDLLQVRAPVPRVRLAPGVVRVRDFEAAVERTRTLKVTPGESVVVEEDGVPEEAGAGGEARYVSFTANTVRLFVRAAGRAFVVLNEAWDPGWVARVDGDEVPVRRVNALARGVWVEAGEHVVDFSYEPVSVRIGATVSGLTLVGVLVAEVVRRRRQRIRN